MVSPQMMPSIAQGDQLLPEIAMARFRVLPSAIQICGLKNCSEW
jgi:hypothetical protein